MNTAKVTDAVGEKSLVYWQEINWQLFWQLINIWNKKYKKEKNLFLVSRLFGFKLTFYDDFLTF